MSIVFKNQGNFKSTEKFLKRNKQWNNDDLLVRYAKEGVKALSDATPIDSGETASSWGYRINKSKGRIRIEWTNSNTTPSGTPIAILIQYGHATRNGGYVEGIDFINPAIRPVFNTMVEKLWREVNKP